MCGLAGIIGKYNSIDRNLMLKSMVHRGPDRQNYFENKDFCFMHALLKIMDLSDNSLQPMTDDISGNVIIFNGSIYNYKDLKRNFFSNENFKSNSDTEIILKLYSKFGLNFTNYIKGMFAIALYDKKKNKIIIVRDRVAAGEKTKNEELTCNQQRRILCLCSNLCNIRVLPTKRHALHR